MGDLENKLKKLDVATGGKLQRELLEGIYTDSEVAVGYIATLSGRNGEITPALKFVNQLGDYAGYLSKKAEAEGLTADEKDTLRKLGEIVGQLNEAFLAAGESVAEGGNIYAALGDELGAIGDIYEAVSDNNVEYPELIYDGPFSDGLNDRETKFLNGKETITADEAVSVAGEIFGGEFYVEVNALFFLHLVDEFFKVLLADFHDDVGEHLNESPVAVPGPAGVAGLCGEGFHNVFVEAEVEDGIHHAGHGCARTRANGDEKGILLIAELFAGDLFHLIDIFHYFLLDVGIDLSAVLVILGAGLGGNRETLGYGQTDFGHLGEVCALAAEQFSHARIAFTEKVAILFSHK